MHNIWSAAFKTRADAKAVNLQQTFRLCTRLLDKDFSFYLVAPRRAVLFLVSRISSQAPPLHPHPSFCTSSSSSGAEQSEHSAELPH